MGLRRVVEADPIHNLVGKAGIADDIANSSQRRVVR